MANDVADGGFEDWAYAENDNQLEELIFKQVSAYDSPQNKSQNYAFIRGMTAYLGKYYNLSTRFQGVGDNTIETLFGVNRVNLNLTAMVIDSLTAKLANMPIICQACTNKGTAKGRQLAEDLNFLMLGAEHKYKIRMKHNLAMRDALIARSGFMKVGFDDGKMFIERLTKEEVVIDFVDGLYNDPHKIVQYKAVPKKVLKVKYPELATKINNSDSLDLVISQEQPSTVSTILVEAWCKNTYRKKGRHVIAIKGCIIVDEEWDKDYLPIVKYDYNPPVIGPYGPSLVDELESLQTEINRVMSTMQVIYKNMSVPRIFYDINSGFNAEKFTNRPGVMAALDLKNGVAPIIHNGAAMPPELPPYLQSLIEWGYARAGLTTTETQGQQPTGLESGEAIQTMADIKSERWKFFQENYEQTYIKLMEVILAEMRYSSENVNVIDKKLGLRQISTKKIPKDLDSYVIQLFPTSSLPKDFEGKIDLVMKLVQMGRIPQEAANSLIELPDLGSQQTLIDAPMNWANELIETIINDKKYVSFDRYDNIPYLYQSAKNYYALEKTNKSDEKVLKLLRQLINDCEGYIQANTPPAPPPQPAPSQPGQGQPQ